MPQKFFTNTIESKFIKNLLLNSQVPIMPTVGYGDLIVGGMVYYYDNYVIECTTTCRIGDRGYTNNFKRLYPLMFGEAKQSVTSNFHSKGGYYNTETHEALGRYLRALRDMRGINLMPLYNCFSYRVVSDVTIDTAKDARGKFVTTYSNNSNDSYKVLSIPICFNRKYTIAIDCATTVQVMPAIYGKLGMIVGADGNTLTDEVLKSSPIATFEGVSFKSPVVHEVHCEDASLLHHERNLRLLIQLPKSNDSSVVVLEGDYSNADCIEVFNMENVDSEVSNKVRNLFHSPSLLQINSKVSYAFSDRLIEFLLLNAIDDDDSISSNFGYAMRGSSFKSNGLNIWSEELKVHLYRTYMGIDDARKTDISGYVDKDVETIMNRGAQR